MDPEIWKHLAASGPVAIVLGTIAYKLWHRLLEKEMEFKEYRDSMDIRIDSLHKSVVETIRELVEAIKGDR